MLYTNHVPVCSQNIWISGWFNKTFFFKLVDLIKTCNRFSWKKKEKKYKEIMDCINSITITIDKGDRGRILGWIFHHPILPLDKFAYNSVKLLVLLKKIWIYIIFVISLVKDKYNLLQFGRNYFFRDKVINICIYNFNQNQNFIKNIAYTL